MLTPGALGRMPAVHVDQPTDYQDSQDDDDPKADE
jgi:hypothetical protein